MLTLLGLCFTFYLTAQDEEPQRSKEVILTKSNPYGVIDTPIKRYFATENGAIAIKILGRGKNSFIFQVFEGDRLNERYRVEEKIEVPGYMYEYIQEIDGRLFLFYSAYDRPSTTEQLFVREINTEKGGFLNREKLLVSIPEKISSYFGYGKFNFDLSDNKKMFIIKYRHLPQSRLDSQNQDVIGMQVFDNDLELIWKDDITMPYMENLMENMDFSVDSEGNGYFLIKKYEEAVKIRNRNDPSNSSLEIHKVTPDGEMHKMDFSIGSYLIVDAIIQETSADGIICAGYYRKPGNSGIDGVFTTKLNNKNLTLSEPLLYEFSVDFIKQYYSISERTEKRMEKKEEDDRLSLNNLRMRQIRSFADGSVLIVGEIYYVTSYTDSKGNTHYTYHYNDIILTSINAQGELAWMKKIPKRSTTESYRLQESEAHAYVIFTDNPKNADLPDDRSPHGSFAKERFVIAYKIDMADGTHEYLPMFGYTKIDDIPVYQYALNRVIALSPNSFAVELYIKGKQDMMFKVEFEE